MTFFLFFEYADIVLKLNEFGYNCLAIDLRSGGSFAGKPNVTNQEAMVKERKHEMMDAQQDIKAVIDYLHKRYRKDVIVWGSSFLANLALLEEVDNVHVKAIIGCSP